MFDENYSDGLPVNAGVSHGSILEALLFIVHLDDMVDNIACVIRLYADDVALLKSLHNSSRLEG